MSRRTARPPGEIVARGNVIMAGYYNDPDATEKCMGDGWFHTGDAAVVHPDGYVQITDRLKDVIISGGENISSVEVEAMLLRHDGDPGSRRGRRAAREVGRGAARVRGLQERADRHAPTHCARSAASNMAHFKVPHAFTPVTELPKTATGKIQKFVLRQGRANITAQ